MQECSSEHLRMGTARRKQDNDTEEERRRRVNMERSTAARKQRSPDGLTIARADSPPGIAIARSVDNLARQILFKKQKYGVNAIHLRQGMYSIIHFQSKLLQIYL